MASNVDSSGQNHPHKSRCGVIYNYNGLRTKLGVIQFHGLVEQKK